MTMKLAALAILSFVFAANMFAGETSNLTKEQLFELRLQKIKKIAAESNGEIEISVIETPRINRVDSSFVPTQSFFQYTQNTESNLGQTAQHPASREDKPIDKYKTSNMLQINNPINLQAPADLTKEPEIAATDIIADKPSIRLSAPYTKPPTSTFSVLQPIIKNGSDSNNASGRVKNSVALIAAKDTAANSARIIAEQKTPALAEIRPTVKPAKHDSGGTIISTSGTKSDSKQTVSISPMKPDVKIEMAELAARAAEESSCTGADFQSPGNTRILYEPGEIAEQGKMKSDTHLHDQALDKRASVGSEAKLEADSTSIAESSRTIARNGAFIKPTATVSASVSDGQEPAFSDLAKKGKMANADRTSFRTSPKASVTEKASVDVSARPQDAHIAERDYFNVYSEGLAKFYAHDFVKALALFSQLVQNFPNHELYSSSLYWAGECYRLLGDNEKSIAALNQVLSCAKSDKIDDALVQLGIIYVKQGDKQRAKSQFEQLINRYPNSEYYYCAFTWVKKINKGS
jgi:TolA-binding protein